MWAAAARELLQPIILSLGTLLAFSHENEVKVVNNPGGWKNDVGDEYNWQGFFDQFKDIYPWKDKTIDI